MCEEQQPRTPAELLAQLPVVEGGEPRLAESRSEHDDRAPSPLLPTSPERLECRSLDLVRARHRIGWLGLHLAGWECDLLPLDALRVLRDPFRVEWACSRPELVEGLADTPVRGGIAVAVDA